MSNARVLPKRFNPQEPLFNEAEVTLFFLAAWLQISLTHPDPKSLHAQERYLMFRRAWWADDPRMDWLEQHGVAMAHPLSLTSYERWLRANKKGTWYD